jgi:multicomponent K+:H+ antiporter subunit G
LIGSIGLLRFKTFYERVHAPGARRDPGPFQHPGCVDALLLASAQTRPVVHEILIGIFVTTTTPVTFMFLVQATLYRDRFEGTDPLAGLSAEQPHAIAPDDPIASGKPRRTAGS